MKDGIFIREELFDFYNGSLILIRATECDMQLGRIIEGVKRYYVNGKQVLYCDWDIKKDGTCRIDIITEKIENDTKTTQ